ncbi:MAG: hypothetical protein IKD45_00545, partial [Clostridia bacterium]|nr:hypothetical protein [Clostridia bacterium]
NSVKLSSTYSYTKCVSKVYYKDFGAVGDGETDDYEAMYKAHIYANQCGQTVCADGDDAVYYVHIFHNGDIPVKTDVCLGNSKIIINDTGSQVYAKRGQHLYRLVKDNDGVSYSENNIKNMFGDVKLSVGQTKIEWLAPYLETDSLVRFINKYHKDFVRNGANEDAGYNRMDVVMVDADGNVDPETPIIFEFDKITEIRIIRADDAPITFDGGYFETICCTVVPETEMKNVYHSYGRGICVYRANATVKNVKHRMVKEPVADGTRSESYPYHAFLTFDQTYNAKTFDLDLTGHTTYAAHENGVSMGSYDFVIMYSIGVEFYGLQQNGVDIKDQKYWGIMASNGVKNIKFVDCEMSRFDAHRGFYNGELENCTIGFAFNVIGGGLLKATNVTKSTGSEFISLRGDYGATFEGDMELINCNLAGYKNYNSSRGVFTGEKLTTGLILKCDFASTSDDEAYQEYLNWNFGYTCYMPQNILLDNFQYGTSELYVFNKIGRGDDVFSPDIANTYMITQNITFRNMQNLPLVQNPSVYTKLSSIPVVNETKTED